MSIRNWAPAVVLFLALGSEALAACPSSLTFSLFINGSRFPASGQSHTATINDGSLGRPTSSIIHGHENCRYPTTRRDVSIAVVQVPKQNGACIKPSLTLGLSSSNAGFSAVGIATSVASGPVISGNNCRFGYSLTNGSIIAVK